MTFKSFQRLEDRMCYEKYIQECHVEQSSSGRLGDHPNLADFLHPTGLLGQT